MFKVLKVYRNDNKDDIDHYVDSVAQAIVITRNLSINDVFTLLDVEELKDDSFLLATLVGTGEFSKKEMLEFLLRSGFSHIVFNKMVPSKEFDFEELLAIMKVITPGLCVYPVLNLIKIRKLSFEQIAEIFKIHKVLRERVSMMVLKKKILSSDDLSEIMDILHADGSIEDRDKENDRKHMLYLRNVMGFDISI